MLRDPETSSGGQYSVSQQKLSKSKTKVIKSIIKIKQFNFAGREKVIRLFGKAKDIGRTRQTAGCVTIQFIRLAILYVAPIKIYST